jgi:hypothetical protein
MCAIMQYPAIDLKELGSQRSKHTNTFTDTHTHTHRDTDTHKYPHTHTHTHYLCDKFTVTGDLL